MSRILAYTSPARGHLFPLTPILDELRDRGHEIVLRTLAAEVETMRGRGFDAAPMDLRIEAIMHDDWQAKSPQKALARSVKVFGRRAEYEVPDLKKAIDDERPEALILDINCYGGMAVAEGSGLPWTAFCPYPLPLRSKDAPPFGPGFAPATGPAGRLRDRVVGKLVHKALAKQLLPLVNEVRGGEGLRSFSTTDDLFKSPPLLLYMTAEPFEYARSDWPSNVVMVGPCAWEPSAERPGWLEREDRPIVLVTTSSEFQDDAKIVEAAFAGLVDQDVAVVATVPARDAGQFSPPPNARVESFVPHGPILERAICAVTHGGMGATQKALAHGVPVVVVPHGRDQLEVARRAEVAGAGVRLSTGKLTARTLRDAVEKSISLSGGARRVAEGFADTGGASSAADAFELQIGSAAAQVKLTG